MDRNELLTRIPIFESLEPADVALLTAQLDEVSFLAGATVFAAGDAGTSLYLIDEGEVSIQLPPPKGAPGASPAAPVVVATLHKGQYFGEISLLDGMPRSASAIATRDTTTLRLERQDLIDLVHRRPGAAMRILAELGERLRQTNELLTRRAAQDVNAIEERALSFGDRVADRIAEVGGSWPFVIGFFVVLFGWIGVNIGLGARAFDEFPFIFLNLMLSVTAAVQAPVIMMSQNRSSLKDRLAAQVDYQVNLKNELGIERMEKSLDELKNRMALLDRAVASSSGRPSDDGRATSSA